MTIMQEIINLGTINGNVGNVKTLGYEPSGSSYEFYYNSGDPGDWLWIDMSLPRGGTPRNMPRKKTKK